MLPCCLAALLPCCLARINSQQDAVCGFIGTLFCSRNTYSLCVPSSIPLQLNPQAITQGDPPLAPAEYGESFGSFVASCLVKNANGRPLYQQHSPNGQAGALMQHHFYVEAKKAGNRTADMMAWKESLDCGPGSAGAPLRAESGDGMDTRATPP